MKLPFLSRFTTPSQAQPLASRITYAATLGAGPKARFGALLAGVLHDLPDLLAVSVIHLGAGEVVATYHLPGKLNPGKAAVHNAEIFRQKQLALKSLGLADAEAIQDILVTLSTQWHVLRPLPGGRHALHLMVNIRDTNLAIARDVLRAHAEAPAPGAQAG